MQNRGVIVRLEWQEALAASQAGLYRTLYALYKCNGHKYGLARGEQDLGRDVRSTLAELAVAKYLGVFWSGLAKDCKDTTLCEVRSTPKPDNPLVIRDSDSPDDIFVLVTTEQIPALRLVGWIRARDGMLDSYVKAPCGRPPAYFIPQSALHPMEDLRQQSRRNYVEM